MYAGLAPWDPALRRPLEHALWWACASRGCTGAARGSLGARRRGRPQRLGCGPNARGRKPREYRVKLLEPPLAGKDHLVLIITPRPDGRLDADLHLKSRFGFDLATVVGHFEAQSIPPTPP